MGSVIRESIKSSFASYLGLLIGTINIIFLYTKFFTPQELGLTRVLQDSTILLVAFAQLGSPSIIIRFFPKFADKTNNNNGFLPFITTYALVGFIIFTLLFIGLQSVYFSFYQQKSPLIVEYSLYIIPLVFGMIFINVMESHLVIQNKLFFPTFIREVFLRISNTIAIILFAIGIINFTMFINLMVLSYFLAVTFLVIYTKVKGSLYLKPTFDVFKVTKFTSIFKYGLFTVLGGIGFLLSNKIDILMLPAYRGLKDTAIYTIALFIATIIEIPKKNLIRAALPALSFAINKNDIRGMDNIYKKTSINLFIPGLLIFLIIWLNIDDIFMIIPNGDLYIAGKTVLFIFLISRIVDLLTGVNSEIILYSKYYYYGLVLIVALGVLTVVTNMIFIPIYGMLGAALASALSLLIYLAFAVILIWAKFHTQPFNKNTVKAFIIFILIWIIAWGIRNIWDNIALAQVKNFIDLIKVISGILLKSLILSLIFIYTFVKLKVSEDFSGVVFLILNKLKGIFKI